MNIFLYIIGFVVGTIICAVGISTILLVLRVGFPICNEVLKEDSKSGAKILKKKYTISLLFWIVAITISTYLCYLHIYVFTGYIIAILLNIFKVISQTSQNEINVAEVLHSIKCNTIY